MSYIDILHKAVDRALEKGAKYAEARYHKIDSFSIVLRNGNVVALTTMSRDGIGLRTYLDGALSYSSSYRLDSESIDYLVENCISSARATTRRLKLKRDPSSPRIVGKANYSVIQRRKFDSVSLEDKISMLKNIWINTSKALTQAKLVNMTIEYQESIEYKELITSDGAEIISTIPRILIQILMTLYEPRKGSIQRIIGFGGSGGLELLDTWNIVDRVTEEVKNLENVLIKGVEPPKDSVDIVLGPELVGLIVHESAGHPMEADRIWGREASQAGESFVKPEMIGKERIGNEHATVVDDPTIPGSFGYYLYDDEGVKARPRYIYLNGVINEPLHSKWSSVLFNTESNGAARAMNYECEPLVRMANTYLTPGDMEFNELIEDIKKGIYIKNFMEWNIDDIRWGQRYIGLECYLIDHGELKEPVRNPVLEFTTKEFYSSIVGKTKRVEFYPGLCGKGEPQQAIPVWLGGPHVRLKKMKLKVVPL